MNIKTLLACAVLAGATLSGCQSAAPAASGRAEPSTAERNKANALAFYDMAFNRHQVKEAAERYIGAQYLQHNPGVGDGGAAFVEAFAPFLKQHPHARATVKRVIAEGDLVALHVHSQTDEQDRGEAVVDIFRFDRDGKIIEHWDVIQSVPSKTASGRSMF